MPARLFVYTGAVDPSPAAAPSADPSGSLPALVRAVLSPPREAIALTVGVLVMGAYWYLGSPGAQLAAGAVRDYDTAAYLCLLSVGLWLVIPAATMAALKVPVSRVGLGLGDVRFNLKVTALAVLLVTVPMAFSAKDPGVQAVYPWPGSSAGQSAGSLATWLATYFLYYVAFEFFFRGYLIRVLEERWGLVTAIWVATICATLVHVGKPWAETLTSFPVSLLFCLQAVRGRSIWWPILIHWWVGSVTDTSSLYWQGQLF